ncbi:hypothetical protein M0811_05470 [Anaeramoeba ignava]|uniref:Uncharacterized protein n=1 Tax=Anaeramoeba ignava TaxID=1746090 RepID=A0A9Q0LV02_ANAIG|nr:hypothetical protein M0811_05470 [Anaeramoeba ignava]
MHRTRRRLLLHPDAILAMHHFRFRNRMDRSGYKIVFAITVLAIGFLCGIGLIFFFSLHSNFVHTPETTGCLSGMEPEVQQKLREADIIRLTISKPPKSKNQNISKNQNYSIKSKNPIFSYEYSISTYNNSNEQIKTTKYPNNQSYEFLLDVINYIEENDYLVQIYHNLLEIVLFISESVDISNISNNISNNLLLFINSSVNNSNISEISKNLVLFINNSNIISNIFKNLVLFINNSNMIPNISKNTNNNEMEISKIFTSSFQILHYFAKYLNTRFDIFPEYKTKNVSYEETLFGSLRNRIYHKFNNNSFAWKLIREYDKLKSTKKNEITDKKENNRKLTVSNTSIFGELKNPFRYLMGIFGELKNRVIEVFAVRPSEYVFSKTNGLFYVPESQFASHNINFYELEIPHNHSCLVQFDIPVLLVKFVFEKPIIINSFQSFFQGSGYIWNRNLILDLSQPTPQIKKTRAESQESANVPKQKTPSVFKAFTKSLFMILVIPSITSIFIQEMLIPSLIRSFMEELSLIPRRAYSSHILSIRGLLFSFMLSATLVIIIDFTNDFILSSVISLSSWGTEIYVIIFIRNKTSMKIFSILSLTIHFAFYFYINMFPFGFTYLLGINCFGLQFFLMVILFYKFELPERQNNVFSPIRRTYFSVPPAPLDSDSINLLENINTNLEIRVDEDER